MTLKELTEMDDLISRWEAFKAVMDDENITNAMDSANDGEMHRTKRAASRIIAGLPSAQQWIPISEQMPPQDVEVLATCGGFVTTAEYIGNDMWFTCEGNSNATTEDIEAWMPIPKPYEVER